jgi:hypothetical protein
MPFKSFVQTVVEEVRESVQTSVDSGKVEKCIGQVVSKYLNSSMVLESKNQLIR